MNPGWIWMFCVVLPLQCGTMGNQNRDADFTGFITEVNIDPLQQVFMSVESHANKLVHRGQFKVPSTCVIVREGSDQPLSTVDLQPKERVRVWLTKQPDARYPETGTAMKIVLIQKHKNDNEQ